MRAAAFDYDLPEELIAQRPAERRELARLMHLPPGSAVAEHRRIADLPVVLEPGTLVVVNDTKVVPARLLGRKRDSGGRVEVLLLRRTGTGGNTPHDPPAEIWQVLGRSTKPLKAGTVVDVPGRGTEGPTRLCIRILRRLDPDATLEVALWTPSGVPVREALIACGHVPLPPYIKRADLSEDSARYQTVYARHDGAVAAPTAGLHLTQELLAQLAARGGEVATITLHVGLGTFQPVHVDDLDNHPMHSESFVVPPSAVDAVARARRRGSPVVAVGTTTVRALESAWDPDARSHVRATRGETRLLIQPGYVWRVVDGLLTNFHLPSSTLLALVAAFAGTERTLDAYRLAVRDRYRFFSYGDAMLVWRGG